MQEPLGTVPHGMVKSAMRCGMGRFIVRCCYDDVGDFSDDGVGIADTPASCLRDDVGKREVLGGTLAVDRERELRVYTQVC